MRSVVAHGHHDTTEAVSGFPGSCYRRADIHIRLLLLWLSIGVNRRRDQKTRHYL